MSDSEIHHITIHPVISYPREAEVGKTYLMSIDIQTEYDAETWPYEREDFALHCILDTKPLFNHKAFGEPVIVLNRFGGTYGPATFFLTAATTPQEGAISVSLVNEQGMPLHQVTLPSISLDESRIYPREREKRKVAFTFVAPNQFIIQPNGLFLQENPNLKILSDQLIQSYQSNQFINDAQLQQMGEALWKALNATKLFGQALTQTKSALTIIIESDSVDIQKLPWETLYHPEFGFLARENGFTLLRRVPGHPIRTQPPDKGPLRALLFTALPDDLDAEKERLDIEAEQAQILNALVPLLAKGLAVLEMPDDGRFSTLEYFINTFSPHLVFLSGHGKFLSDPISKQPPTSTFLFEGEGGSSEPVNAKRIADVFRGNGVECVVLESCELAKITSETLNINLIWQLNAEGIPHVIGMRESVLDRSGTLFASAFADAIARREGVDVAVQAGRRAIITPLKDSPLLSGESVQGEMSLGQWSLPLLLSSQPDRPLLDWNFTAQPTPEQATTNLPLDTVTLPTKFIGRRAELRTLKSRLQAGQLQLLITGPGGQGKTALAGKLALDLQRNGYLVAAYSARPENSWLDFILNLELLLTAENAENYKRMLLRYTDEADKASLLLRLLMQQAGNRVVLFFDNLESLQDPQTQQLKDARLAAWIAAAQRLAGPGLILLLTSRWKLPDWPEGDHLSLPHASYGDFLQMGLALVEQGRLAPAWLANRQRMRQLYDALHGNGQGLAFFAGAVQGMSEAEEAAFLAKLAQAKSEIQTDMALKTIISHLDAAAQVLLERLSVYQLPVPMEGVMKLGMAAEGLPGEERTEAALERLLAVSLVEQTENARWQTREYQLSPLAADWLRQREKTKAEMEVEAELYRVAAEYLQYVFINERRTLAHAVATHQALRAAEAVDDANRLALDYIIGPLNRAGLYKTLLTEWLPSICESEILQVKASGLHQTGLQHFHLGDYHVALNFLQRALKIRQEIGDRAGEGATLNNISQIYRARGDYETALTYLQQALKISQEIGDRAAEGSALNNISQIYIARGDYETALSYLQQALKISQEIGDKAGEGTTLNNISQIYDARGDYDTALGFLQRALKIRQEIGDKSGKGTTLDNLSQIFYARGDYDTALDFLQRALKIRQEIGDKSGEGTTLNNLSQIFYARGDYDTALDFLQHALKIRQEIGDKSGEGTTLNNISRIFQARSDQGKALDFAQRSLTISQEIGDVAGLCATLFNMGHIHMQNGEQNEALSAWVTVYTVASQINLAQALQALEQLAGQLGQEGGLAFWAALTQQMENTAE